MSTFLIVLLIISSLTLILSILMSPPKVQGMSSSFGGGAETLFGRKKAKGFNAMLEKITIVSAVIFMLSAFIYAIIA